MVRRAPLLAALASGGAIAALGACSFLEDFGRYSDADKVGDAAFDATADTRIDANPSADGGDGSVHSCPGRAGPTMVDVGPFCIDSTEVTQRDYAAFLAAKSGDPSGQPAVCAANTSFEPLADLYGRRPDAPVVGIDWCDAVAYCTWAGKRLCGKIGGGSVPSLGSLPDDPNVSQWYYACSRNGAQHYPYGDTLDRTACNAEGGASADVKTFPRCEGGFPGLFDMTGNVWEWEDACDDKGSCANRGSAYMHPPESLACRYDSSYYARGRMDRIADTGFRCCGP